MNRSLIIALVLLLLPAGALAAAVPAEFSAGRSLFVASSSPGNAYATGASVVITAPVAGDLAAVGGSVISAAPISGDALLVGGSVSSRAPVAGDLRAFGGSVDVLEPVAGDLILGGVSVNAAAPAKGSVFIIAANARISGSGGPVVMYGNDVALAGEYAGDVTVTSSGHLVLAPNTVIRGTFSYEAPELATIPASVKILGGVKYTKVSYLPSADTSHVLELMSIGFFLLVRVFGALILAGLLAGLFPRLAEAVVGRAYLAPTRSILLTTLLGFAVLVATPILLLLLMLTFVGIGVAALLLIIYALLVLLASIYAGILIGSALARRFTGRTTVFWRDGVLGMLILSLVMLVPVLGMIVFVLLAMFCAGALLLMFFGHAFAPEEPTPDVLE